MPLTAELLQHPSRVFGIERFGDDLVLDDDRGVGSEDTMPRPASLGNHRGLGQRQAGDIGRRGLPFKRGLIDIGDFDREVDPCRAQQLCPPCGA